jgi:hypothetical protein
VDEYLLATSGSKNQTSDYSFMPAKDLNGTVTERNMKRLLRRRASREYFKKGGWTNNPEEAQSFADVVEAAQTCARYGLSDVELALRFDARASEDVFCTRLN